MVKLRQIDFLIDSTDPNRLENQEIHIPSAAPSETFQDKGNKSRAVFKQLVKMIASELALDSFCCKDKLQQEIMKDSRRDAYFNHSCESIRNFIDITFFKKHRAVKWSRTNICDFCTVCNGNKVRLHLPVKFPPSISTCYHHAIELCFDWEDEENPYIFPCSEFHNQKWVCSEKWFRRLN